MRLASLTRPELIFVGLPGNDRAEVLRALAEKMAENGSVADPEELFQKLWEREKLGSTGIGTGVAIPHGKLKGLKHGLVAIGLTAQGIDFQAVDGRPVSLFFVVASPVESPAEHLQVLAAISRWVKGGHRVEKILQATDRDAIYKLLEEEG
jgi:PTS system nitrogen regulatory IIA component